MLFCSAAAGLLGAPILAEQPLLRTLSPEANMHLAMNTIRREFSYGDFMPPMMPMYTENWLAVLTAQRKHDTLCPV